MDKRTGSERTVVGNYVDITAISDRFDCGSVRAESADGRKRVVSKIMRHAKAPAASEDPFAIAERRSDMGDQGRSLTWGYRYWGEYKGRLANERIDRPLELRNGQTSPPPPPPPPAQLLSPPTAYFHEALRTPSVTKTHCGND